MSEETDLQYDFIKLKITGTRVSRLNETNEPLFNDYGAGYFYFASQDENSLMKFVCGAGEFDFMLSCIKYVRPIRNKVYLETDNCFIKILFPVHSNPDSILSIFQVCSKRFPQTSFFDARTEESSAKQYFTFYSQILQQQNMMQDNVRTYTYYQAIINNPSDFRGKAVLDVGTGSGLLAFFAVQAGARVVYAVEASSMAIHAKKLIEGSVYKDFIKVICGKLEDIVLPELVDTIISEPLGYMLLNERMIESYLHAKKFLKPLGNMYPSDSLFLFAPFTDETLYMNYRSKIFFWNNTSFYGIDLTPLAKDALNEVLGQPIIDFIDPQSLLSCAWRHRFRFLSIDETDLHDIQIDFELKATRSGITHGMGFWFEAGFIGKDATFWLSTSPSTPHTHWYQVKILFRNPIFVVQGAIVVGQVVMKANKKQSYDVFIELMDKVNPNITAVARADLKTPCFLGSQVQHNIPIYGEPSSGPL